LLLLLLLVLLRSSGLLTQLCWGGGLLPLLLLLLRGDALLPWLLRRLPGLRCCLGRGWDHRTPNGVNLH
jgi:hypothetical protein